MLRLVVARDVERRMREAVPINRLLEWAYRDELPKREIGGLTGWERLILLGTTIDEPRSDDPGFPIVLGGPHPDALRIDYAVRSQEEWFGLGRIGGDFDVPQPTEKWGPAGLGRQRERRGPDIRQLEQYVADGLPPGWYGNARTTIEVYEPAELLRRHARMGTRPIWDLGPLQVEPARGSRKQPQVSFLDQNGARITGSKRGGYYSTGACCELRYDPEPFESASARAEYLVWYVSLMRVFEHLSTAMTLTDYEPLKPDVPALPWRHGEIKRRILHEIPADVPVEKKSRRR